MSAGAWYRPLSTVLLAGCAVYHPPEPVPVAIYTNTISAALASGNMSLAEETLDRARMTYPDDGGLLLWSAVLSQMRWRENVALNDVRQVSRMQTFDRVSRQELMGWIGDLLFRTGSYAESLPYLNVGEVGEDAQRRKALALLVGDLPYNRREPERLAAELPLTEGSLPELLCTIGDKQRPFVLDTGASFTTLSLTLARELGIHPIIDAGTARDGAGRTFPVAFGVLPSISLGTVELEAQPVLVVDDKHLALRDLFGGPPRAPNGVVGLDILARFRVTFDPERNSVIFALPRSIDPAVSVACLQHDGRCLVPVVIEGKKLWFIMDTGASHSSLTDQGLAALPGGSRRATDTYRRVRAPGGSQISVRQVPDLMLAVAGLSFSGVALPVVERAPTTDFPVHGVLGADILMQCRTTFDRGRLRLQVLD